MIEPINGYVVIKPMKDEDKVVHGVIVSDKNSNRSLLVGEVLAISKLDDPESVHKVQVGDKVLYEPYGLRKYSDDIQDDSEVVLAREEELLGIKMEVN